LRWGSTILYDPSNELKNVSFNYLNFDRCKKIKYKLSRFLFFNAIIVFFLELCLESTISSLITFIVGLEMKSQGDFFSVILALVFLVVNFGMVIALPMGLYVLWQRKNDNKLEHYLSEAVENLRRSKFLSIFYHSGFVIRRLVFVATIFALQGYLCIQLMIFILTNLLYIMYILYAHPIFDGMRTEVFNEVCSLLCSIMLIVFSDFV
jgi:hypothetical protein